MATSPQPPAMPGDRHARMLSYVGIIVSVCSLAVAGGTAWVNYRNRGDVAEQVSVRIARARGDQDVDVQLPAGALVPEAGTVTLPAQRRTWDVLISNTSLSAEVTVIGIVPGQRYAPLEPVADELNRVRFRLTGLPELPISLGPSKTVSFGLVTEMPTSSDHVPILVLATSRGRQYVGTPSQ